MRKKARVITPDSNIIQTTIDPDKFTKTKRFPLGSTATTPDGKRYYYCHIKKPKEVG